MTDVYRLIQKTKRRKYFGEPCDMHVGVVYPYGHPMIERCPQGPTRYIPEYAPFGAYLCNDHFDAFVQKLDSIE